MELRVRSVTKRFGDVTAIDQVTFEAVRGSFITVLGPSGSGKTTLLRCVAGVEIPDRGTIEIGGKIVFSAEEKISVPPEQRRIGMVYQSYALWPHMTVFDNVAYPLKIRGLTSHVDKRVEEVLTMLNMSAMKERYPFQLSGGEQQRVAFARALVYDPEVLLLDEPFSNLDTPLRERLRDELKMVQQQTGITTVYVTHHRIEASSMSDSIVILFDGRVSAIGTPTDLLEHPPNRYVASFLAGLLVLDGIAHSTDGEKIVVQTSVGEVELSESRGASDGQSVEVYVRPSFTRLAHAEGLNRLRGKVLGVARERDLMEYHIGVGQQIVKVPHDPRGGFEPKIQELVFLEVLPGGCTLASL